MNAFATLRPLFQAASTSQLQTSKTTFCFPTHSSYKLDHQARANKLLLQVAWPLLVILRMALIISLQADLTLYFGGSAAQKLRDLLSSNQRRLEHLALTNFTQFSKVKTSTLSSRYRQATSFSSMRPKTKSWPTFSLNNKVGTLVCITGVMKGKLWCFWKSQKSRVGSESRWSKLRLCRML